MPNEVEAYLRGSKHTMGGELNQAIDAFNEAIRIDPKFADAYEARGEAYLKMGETAKAEADRKKAEQLRMDRE